MCARILGRKELGREPSLEEVEDRLKSGRYKEITPPEVMASLDSGTEVQMFECCFFKSLTIKM